MDQEFKNFEGIVIFLDGILEKTKDYAQHMDNQIQILVGISSAIFFLPPNLAKKENCFCWF